MLDIRPLREADIPAALHLSTQSGWNQLAQDWRRLIVLWPQLCLGGWDGNELVATATLAAFGQEIGWVGMVLVDEGRRGQGHGGAMFRRITELCKQVRIARLGLDATDLGRPVYLRQGFADHSRIQRWIRSSGATAPGPRTAGDATKHVRPLEASDWPRLLDLDRQAVGVDRAAMLRHMAAEPGAAVRVMERDRRLIAFAFARPGRVAAMIAPVIAQSPAAAEHLVAALLADRHIHSAEQAIYIDVLADSGLATRLPALGFAVQRTLTRMVQPASTAALLTSPLVQAAAGFELG